MKKNDLTPKIPEENLESKIFTCSLRDYLEFTGLDKSNLELVGVCASKKFVQYDDPLNINGGLYKLLSNKLLEHRYIAITDVRIDQSYYKDNGIGRLLSTIYGTAIKIKKSN